MTAIPPLPLLPESLRAWEQFLGWMNDHLEYWEKIGAERHAARVARRAAVRRQSARLREIASRRESAQHVSQSGNPTIAVRPTTSSMRRERRSATRRAIGQGQTSSSVTTRAEEQTPPTIEGPNSGSTMNSREPAETSSVVAIAPQLGETEE